MKLKQLEAKAEQKRAEKKMKEDARLLRFGAQPPMPMHDQEDMMFEGFANLFLVPDFDKVLVSLLKKRTQPEVLIFNYSSRHIDVN